MNKKTPAKEPKLEVKLPPSFLRDYFAAAAIQGLLSAQGKVSLWPADYASDAYKIADSMIAQRNR